MQINCGLCASIPLAILLRTPTMMIISLNYIQLIKFSWNIFILRMEPHFSVIEKEFSFLRVKCRNKSIVMKFYTDEISYENFLQKGTTILCEVQNQVYYFFFYVIPALQKFGISAHVNFHVNILDQDDFVIEKDDFKDFVNFSRIYFGFYLKIQYDVDFEKTPKIVTPFVSVIVSHCLLFFIFRLTMQYFFFS